MKCPNCNKEVPEKAKVCGYCGTKLEIKQKHSCPEYGKEVPAKAKVCGFCGAKLAKPAGKTQKVASTPTKGPSPSNTAALSLKGKPKWDLIGVIAAFLIIAAVLLWIFTMRPSSAASQPSQPSQPKPIITESAPFSLAMGNWEATDTDGSAMHLKVSQKGANTYTIVYIDEGASICGSDSSGKPLSIDAKGTGTPKGNILEIQSVAGICGETGEEFNFSFQITFDPATDTLSDIGGISWYRK